MILVTGSNAVYWERMGRYLDSLERHADFPCVYVALEHTPASWRYFNVRLAGMTRSQNAGAPMETECIQHGSFLIGQVIDMILREEGGDPVILYTDGDFVMQRPLMAKEKKFLNGLREGEAVTSWNGSESETLEWEATRLILRVSMNKLFEDFGEWARVKPIYNVGFLAMRLSTWRVMYDSYMKTWAMMIEYFEHQARQQWLISYKLAELGIDVKVAPWSLHAHGHFGLKNGMEWREPFLYADGQVAAFRHAWM